MSRASDHINLVQRHQHRLAAISGIEFADLLVDRAEICERVPLLETSGRVQHVHQHLGPPHVAQELVTKPGTLSRTLDQARNVRQ